MPEPISDTPPPFVGFDPALISPRESYKLLTSGVAPRPIALVSTVSESGQPNLAPFSFFMAGGYNPPSLAFAPAAGRDGQPKDTLRNIRETGEFTVSVVSYALREPMNLASSSLGPGESEWDLSGLTPRPGVKVRPARARESLMAMECRLHQIVKHGDGPEAAHYVIGEVVYFHVAASLIGEGGEIDPARLDSIARLGGDWYARAGGDALFTMTRPG